MTGRDILDIAATWSFWEGRVPSSVPRQVELPRELRDDLCLVLQGVRRCGKSTLLQQLIERYDLDPRQCAFLNFEDPRLAGALRFETLEGLVQAFRRRHPDAERLYFFLDEIQGVEGWERWLRTQLERPQGHVFVITGSNASLLSGELGSVLTGRHLTIELFPFNLQEGRTANRMDTLQTYLREGGFPATLGAPDGDMLRRQYFQDIVERDVRERLGARSSRSIRQVVQMAFETAGAEVSLRRIAAAAGIAVDTVANYLDASEAAYLLFSVPYFAWSERKRSHRNRKLYPVDTGLRRVVATAKSDDLGIALECATHLVLRRRFGQIHYWRGAGGEVDFVVQRGRDVRPFQVTWDVPQSRHERALDSFYEAFPHAEEAVFVNADNFAELEDGGLP